ncbi:GNAT family N-acetyltransferase [Alkalicoccobacillus plakortidis]|uniref:GNAT family N-acetyltransferase n=1 Tax=Alkalicoccobacillus plakortidis TaxID=444060 RepID=A0ABT0XL34_9BACI|nr:GNAT family N-acetyltransferase [Alkalicoccobacillus plakortidis]MCM2676621.1 GNAT family N-acetyltransferase [Alkalicoccobacillus plakortidis]
MIKVRQLSQLDCSKLISLSSEVGWDYNENEIHTILKSGQIFGCVDSEDRVVACAAIIQYDFQKVASIGMVIVHPDFRGRGLGREVTEDCIQAVNSNQCLIMLIATEEGKRLYEKMSFTIISHIEKYTAAIKHTNQCEVNNSSVHVYKEQDFNSVVKIDEQAFGDKRERFLTQRLKQSEKRVVIRNTSGEITGYALSIRTPQNVILGPIISECSDNAISLIEELLKDFTGKVRIDLVQTDPTMTRFLEERGFNKVTEPPVMALNHTNTRKRNGHLVAVAAQAFG